jgi:glycine C-acetyltransferase
MYTNVEASLQAELEEIREAGLYKQERVIVTPQSAHIMTQDGRRSTSAPTTT